MSVFSALKAIYTAEWLIAESKQPSLISLANKYLNRELPENTRISFESTFSSGTRYLACEPQRYDYEPYLLENGVLLMPLNDVLFKNDLCFSPGTATIGMWYEKALLDPNVKAVVEHVNSPGGMAEGTAQLAAIKTKFNQVKPIVEYVNEMMCSAALWIGAASSYTFSASPTAIIGSLGAVITYSKKDATDNTVKIYPESSSRKNFTQREAEKGNYKPLQATAAYLDNVFMDFMSLARPNISALALQGEEFFTPDAIANGLVDAEGTLEDAINKALELSNNSALITTNNPVSNNNKNKSSMQFSEIKLGAMLGMLALSASKADGTDKSADEILGEMNAKFSAQSTQLATLTGERDAALSAKTTLEGEKTALESKVTELEAKVAKMPPKKPVMAALKEGDQTPEEVEEVEVLPSFKWMQALNEL